jgi:hypothetical protein
MNKIQTISLAILGGIEAVFRIASPILLALIWNNLFIFNNFGSYVILIIAIISSLFRAIKIGWMEK